MKSWKDYFANLMNRVGEFGKLAPEAMRGLNALSNVPAMRLAPLARSGKSTMQAMVKPRRCLGSSPSALRSVGGSVTRNFATYVGRS